MAVYSEPIDNLDYGGAYDVPIDVWIYRGDCNRTATSVSFSFGVCFKPETNTTQSIAAWYGGTKKYAYHNKAGTNYNGTANSNRAKKGTYYYAHYNHDDSGNYKIRTSESLCFSYTNNSINANTTSVSVTVGLGWNAHNPTQVGTQTFSIAIPKFIGPVGTGTTTITDNYNNSFTITATKGADGINNPAGGPDTLNWSYDIPSYTNSYTSGSPIALTTVTGNSSTRTVYAVSRTTSSKDIKHKPATTHADIRQYVGPGKIAGCGILFSKGKPVLKEDWTLRWSKPGTNNDCPIKGYQVILYRKRGTENWKAIPMYDTDGNILIASTTNYSYYTGSANTSLTLGAKYFTEDYGNTIEPGDKIKFSVKAYTKFGKNYDVGGAVFNNTVTATESIEYTIQNSGIMRVKANNAWTEGQVWVKVDDNWKEADAVKVKVNRVWEDSE
jgi:hypothetical protein